MQKGLGKDKPRGKDRGKMKSKFKKKRILEEKKNKKRAEVKRQNSERRKEKGRFEEIKELVSQVEITGFEKGMIIVRIQGKEEKRSLKLEKGLKSEEFRDNVLENLEIKLFGNYFKVSELNGFEDVKAKVEEYLAVQI